MRSKLVGQGQRTGRAELTTWALCSAARAAALRTLSSGLLPLVSLFGFTACGFDTAVVGVIFWRPFGGAAVGAVERVPRRCPSPLNALDDRQPIQPVCLDPVVVEGYKTDFPLPPSWPNRTSQRTTQASHYWNLESTEKQDKVRRTQY